MKFTILILILALSATYWFTPAYVMFHVRNGVKTFFGAPPIICANAKAPAAPRESLANVLSAFDPSERLANDDFNPPAGQLVLANEGRFESNFYSEPLTQFTVGWLEKQNVKATLDSIAPEVPVGRRFEFKKMANVEAFLSETDDVRAIGADFKRVEYTGTTVNEKTYNKGLTIRIDDDEQFGADWQERSVIRLTERLYRNELRRAIALLSAAANNTAVTWDSTAGKDPDFDVLAKIEASGDDRGLDSNMVLFGSTSWRKRALSHRAQNTAGGFASAMMSADELAQRYGVDQVVISRERYQSSASAKTQIVANKVIIYMAYPGIGKDDPSDIKRFVSAVAGGGFLRVYVQRMNAKSTDITVEHYSNLVTPDTLGMQQLTVS